MLGRCSTLRFICAAVSVHVQNFSAADLAHCTIERRAVEAAISGMPLVNVDAMRQPYFPAGAKCNDVIFWSNSRSLCIW